jgi:hypothetical protein
MNKEGILKSTMNSVLLRLGLQEKIETNLKANLADNKGVVLYDSDSLTTGSVVFMESAEGRVDLSDGEYTLEDGRKMVVKAGAVESITELKKETPKEVETVEENEAADVQMALVDKIIELSNEKTEAKVSEIKAVVAAELSKIPVVAPMVTPSRQEIVSLSRQELSVMNVDERVNHYAVNLMKKNGSYKPFNINLASGEPDIVTTYAGRWAAPYIGAALLSGETLANNRITVKERVPLTGLVVKTLALGDNLKTATCDFTHSGTVDLDERTLVPSDLQVHLELCKNDLLLDWENEAMGAGRNNKNLPPNFASFLLMRVAAKTAGVIETKLWQGAAGADSFEGIEAKLTTTTAMTGGAVTAANVKTKLRIVTAAIPTALKFNRDVKLFCAADILQAFIELQGDNGYMNTYQATPNYTLMFDGYELVYSPGISTGSCIAATRDNLWFGTDLIGDTSLARVIDMEQTTGSNNVRVIMKFTAGTQVGVLADCVHGIQAV